MRRPDRHFPALAARLLSVGLLVAAWAGAGLQAQQGPIRSEVDAQELKSQFFIKVCSFIDWPKDSDVSDPSKPFVIGVLGGPPMSVDNPWSDPFVRAMLDTFPRTRIKNKKVTLKIIDYLDSVKGCHAIYLMPAAKNHISGTVKLVRKVHTLLFASTEGFAELGVHLNFQVLDQRLRFEINESSLQDSGLKVDSLILRSAIVVKRREVKP